MPWEQRNLRCAPTTANSEHGAVGTVRDQHPTDRASSPTRDVQFLLLSTPFPQVVILEYQPYKRAAPRTVEETDEIKITVESANLIMEPLPSIDVQYLPVTCGSQENAINAFK